MSRVHLATYRIAEPREGEQLNGDLGRGSLRSLAGSDGLVARGPDGARLSGEVGFQRLAEAVRGCWSGKHLFDLPLGARVLLVVSSVHSEGASTVARNLARRLGETGGSRVLLVDANLRRRSQHRALRVGTEWGLTDLISEDVPGGHQRVLDKGKRGFVFLPCGRLPDSPSQLLGRAETGQVFRDLASRFDWIVVDGPPVTVYSDAAILARLADAAILVVRAETTRQEVIVQAKRTLDESGVRTLGAVLNRRRYHIPEFVYRHLLRDDSARSQH